jgi:hypothetical protein
MAGQWPCGESRSKRAPLFYLSNSSHEVANVRALPIACGLIISIPNISRTDEGQRLCGPGSPSADEREYAWTQLPRQKQAAVSGVDVGCSAIASLDYVRSTKIHHPKTSALKHEDALWLRRSCLVPPLMFKIARVRDISQVIASGITAFLSASAKTAF